MKQSSRFSQTLLAAAIGICVIPLAACGGGGGSGSGTAASNASPQPSQTVPSGTSATSGTSGGATSTTSTTSTSSTGSGTSTSTSSTSSASAPLALYTDVVSGPTSGAENNDGMYLSIFGKNFGSNLSNVKVTIGGQPVAKLYYLGTSLGRPDIEQLSMQVGSLGGAAQGKALPIVVTVNGVASNSNLTFTPNPGKICYVSNAAGVTPEGTTFPAGNDSTGACGDITHPFATVQGSSEYTGGAWPNVGAGDTIVLLPTQTPYSEAGYGSYFMRFYRGPGSASGGSAPTGANGTGYTSLIGYPGASSVPFISAPSITNSTGAVSASDSTSSSPYIVVADLRINGGGGDGAVNTQILSNYARVVNNDLSATKAQSTARSGCIAGDGYYMEILGNSCHDVDSPDPGLENHGVYLDAAGNDEIAYNFLYDINDGNGVQLYNSAGTTPNITNVSIHHNWIFNVAKHGINIADSSKNGIDVYDNVVANTAYAGIRFNTVDLTGCRVFNNTFYDTDISGSSNYGVITNDWNLPAGAVTFANNIFDPANGSSFFGGSVGINSTNSTFSNNLYFDGNVTASSIDTGATFADPQFTAPPTPLTTQPSPSQQYAISASSAFDLSYFTPKSTSPAIGGGSSAVSSLVTNDFALTPVGANFDMGALH